MDVERILSQMTLEEKAGLCSGEDAWSTKAVERLGIPAVNVEKSACPLPIRHF